MQRRLLALGLPLLLGSGGRSQAVVLPSIVATKQPPISNGAFSVNGTSFKAPESHTQLIYDVLDIAPPVAVWRSLQLRAAGSAASNPPFVCSATIQLASCAQAPASMTGTFAANLATALAVTVFAGTVSLPATIPSPWPTGWQAPVVFTVPYLYAQSSGQALLLDLVQRSTSGSWWSLEAWPIDYGTSLRVTFPPGICRLANGSGTASAQGSPTPYLGASWSLGYVFFPLTTPILVTGVAAVGVRGPGGAWAGLTLPVDMAPFGAPGCSWATSADVTLPLTGVVGSMHTGSIQIPNVPSLGGQIFYDQAILFDAAANSLGIVTSGATLWKIGSLRGAPGAVVEATGSGSATAATGTYTNGVVTTVRFN